jgi:splicing factor 3B subunit 2
VIGNVKHAKEESKDEVNDDEDANEAPKAKDKKQDSTSDDEDEEGGEGGQKQLGRKARKKASRLSVAELKQLVARPDVVEAHDITSTDPRLLVFLKSYRNTVPVPRHWCHKRKYLQGKRGIEKPPFQLPEFIGATGIEKIRSALIEQEAAQSAKQKGRGRVAPKMGKIDIDYQVLHDAFFKYQKKPSLSHHGDLYYEGKEFEVKLRSKTPGLLSQQLRSALAIPDGAPPPWLINMQRYGPPPAYPNLKIPGLNAPIPAGARFGFQPGEWGKPPVDE